MHIDDGRSTSVSVGFPTCRTSASGSLSVRGAEIMTQPFCFFFLLLSQALRAFRYARLGMRVASPKLDKNALSRAKSTECRFRCIILCCETILCIESEIGPNYRRSNASSIAAGAIYDDTSLSSDDYRIFPEKLHVHMYDVLRVGIFHA